MARSYFALLAPIALATIPQGGLSAQDDPGTIVVTGQREAEPGEVRNQARAITPRGATLDEPLARFLRPICVAVWGLDDESAQFIIDRIYYNAEKVGAKVEAEVGCRPNVFALFVSDVDAELEDLLDSDHHLVKGLSFWERKRLGGQNGPVRSWNSVITRSNGGTTSNGKPPVFDSTIISRTNSAVQLDMGISVVMLDSKALVDRDGLAVADYITMRTLVRTLPPAQNEATLRTILSLFDEDGTQVDSLTAFDEAYLAQVYASRANLPRSMALRNLPGIIEQIEERAK